MINKIKRQTKRCLPFVIAFLYGDIVYGRTAPDEPTISKEEEIYNSLKTIKMDRLEGLNAKTKNERKIRDILKILMILPFDDLNDSLLQHPLIKNTDCSIVDLDDDNKAYITAYPLLLQLHHTKSYLHAVTGHEKATNQLYPEKNMWSRRLLWILHARLAGYFVSKEFQSLLLTQNEKKELIGDYADFQRGNLPSPIKDELRVFQDSRPHIKKMSLENLSALNWLDPPKEPTDLDHIPPAPVVITSSQSTWVRPSTIILMTGSASFVAGGLLMNRESKRKKDRKEYFDILNSNIGENDW